MKKKIGIIGCGNMGSAIAERIKSAYTVYVFDKDRAKTDNLKKIKVSESIVDLLSRVDAVILAVKPQDFDAALSEMRALVGNRLVISIAAGIPTSYIEKNLGRVRAMRVMPNLPARIGKGVSCLAKGRFCNQQDAGFAWKLFSYLGKALKIKEESMNAVTAVSGSGPAYVCYYLESGKDNFLTDFQKAAEGIGFSPKEAKFLVRATYSGTLDFLKKTRIAPARLRKQVTSKGGTTEAALKTLDEGGSLKEAVKAACARARELAKKE